MYVKWKKALAYTLGIHILTTSEDPSVDNADFLEGCEA